MDTPISKANIFNTALPAAEASLVGANMPCTMDPGYLLIYFHSSLAGILRFARTRAGATVVEDLNGGGALTAASGYAFSVPWRHGDEGNLRYSVTGGTYTLICDEFGGE
jgi:hypothetical protein